MGILVHYGKVGRVVRLESTWRGRCYRSGEGPPHKNLVLTLIFEKSEQRCLSLFGVFFVVTISLSRISELVVFRELSVIFTKTIPSPAVHCFHLHSRFDDARHGKAVLRKTHNPCGELHERLQRREFNIPEVSIVFRAEIPTQ